MSGDGSAASCSHLSSPFPLLHDKAAPRLLNSFLCFSASYSLVRIVLDPSVMAANKGLANARCLSSRALFSSSTCDTKVNP